MTPARKSDCLPGGISLSDLATEVEILNPRSLPDSPIRSITADSRLAGPGALFVAIPGLKVDGHDYLEAAVQKGCAAVLVGRGRCRGWRHPGVACLEVVDTQKALGLAAAKFYRHPARRMRMIGITGTNGKTTSTYLLEAIIRQAGGKPGVIGTVNYRYGQVEVPAPFTTPEPVRLQKILAEMAEAGVTHVLMEVSSHALEQKRVAGISFDAALFTNLSRDHLDYHGDMESYFASKKLLFAEYLKKSGKAAVLCGSAAQGSAEWGRRLAAELLADRSLGYGRKGGRSLLTCGFSGADLAVRQAEESLDGIHAALTWPNGELEISSALVGDFNLENILGAVALAQAIGIGPEEIASGLVQARSVPGRLERVAMPADGPAVFVDFAHSPDALAKVLATMRRLTSGRLIVLFGCGGDRDRGKRPLMGRVAARLADVVVLTSDNPRSEEPQAILADIEAGVAEAGLPRMRLAALLGQAGARGYDVIASRRQAIRETIGHARSGEVVLLCGKGHETYQITREGKFFFDDRLEAEAQGEVVRW